MKYVGRDEKVRTLIAERHLFKGVKNSFTDSLLYQDSLEADENLYPEELTLVTKQIRSRKKTNVLGK